MPCSASGVVFANKAVFSHHNFYFTYALTLIHTLFTLVGMWFMSSGMGLFVKKPLPVSKVAPLAAAFVGEQCLTVLMLAARARCRRLNTPAGKCDTSSIVVQGTLYFAT